VTIRAANFFRAERLFAQGRLAGEKSMQVIGLFVVCVFILNAGAVAICSIVERTSSFASLLVFLGFFIVNFVIAWKIALWLTEKYLVSDAQKRANEDHIKWVSSLFPARR
jgi:hypothetical protein